MEARTLTDAEEETVAAMKLKAVAAMRGGAATRQQIRRAVIGGSHEVHDHELFAEAMLGLIHSGLVERVARTVQVPMTVHEFRLK